MRIKKQNLSVKRLNNMNNRNNLDFDFAIQRKSDIWNRKRKSMLIHSLLIDIPIPPVYAIMRKTNQLIFIDGKQRITTILDFLEDGFSLDRETPDVNEIEIRSRKFSKLPKEIQNKILDYKIEVYRVEDASMAEIEDLFYRLNNGMPLRKIEQTRAILGGKLLIYIERIANTPFFQEKVNVTRGSRKRFVDQELVLQILALIHNRNTGLSGRELQNFAKELRKVDLQKDLITKVQNVCYYLNEAFPEKQKFLRKMHIPPIFIVALENQEKQQIISPKEFGEWCIKFFENMPEEYEEATKSGSAKKENVQKRLKTMRVHHDLHFKNKIKNSKSINKFVS